MVLDQNYSRVHWEDGVEEKDSTHQDWDKFHLEEEEENDDWDVTTNIRPSGIELAPNLRHRNSSVFRMVMYSKNPNKN